MVGESGDPAPAREGVGAGIAEGVGIGAHQLVETVAGVAVDVVAQPRSLI